jgi:hypothetical protein
MIAIVVLAIWARKRKRQDLIAPLALAPARHPLLLCVGIFCAISGFAAL